MPSYDQQHATSLARMLQEEGYDSADLLAAALLHDAGKTVGQRRPMHLWHRVAVVLIKAVWPDLLDRLAEGEPDGWRRPFFLQKHHAQLGAELAMQAGCSAQTVDVIRHHEDPESEADDPLLVAFRLADGAN
jgi:putative nucleotidyltransferase with HDIG domain